ncbi:unnamed protein product, partial [Heterotrigona itama]
MGRRANEIPEINKPPTKYQCLGMIETSESAEPPIRPIKSNTDTVDRRREDMFLSKPNEIAYAGITVTEAASKSTSFDLLDDDAGTMCLSTGSYKRALAHTFKVTAPIINTAPL